MMKPGVYCWGGSSGWRSSQLIPYAAIDKWEAECGFKDQHHLLQLGLDSFYDQDGRGHFRPEGLEMQTSLARRIINGGGEVQLMIWATPAHLASVPLTSKDETGRYNWMKYQPTDFGAWANTYADIVKKISTKIDMNHAYVGIGMESFRFYFRESPDVFLRLTDATQMAIKPLGLPHIGFPQVPDLDDGQMGRMPQFIPIWDYVELYLQTAKAKGWRIDFLPLFHYSGDAEASRVHVRLARRLLDEYGFKATVIIWNGLSPGSAARNTQLGVQQCIEVGRMLIEEGVAAACWDFLEDSSEFTNFPQYFETANGLLEFRTLTPRPRYALAKKISLMPEAKWLSL